MRKIKFSVIEILGYTGICLWMAVLFFREQGGSSQPILRFLLGVLPNVGAAWVFTMLGKWAVTLGCKRDYTVAIHLALCGIILALGLGSEIVHDRFLNSPFDWDDMLAALSAQALMVCLPLACKQKCFAA